MAIYLELSVLEPQFHSPMKMAQPLLPSRASQIAPGAKPEWLKIRPPAGENYHKLKKLLRTHKLHTVCEEAHCPNVAECWATGTATFMLGGDVCTRACRFCAIQTARKPAPLNKDEPEQIAKSIAALNLKYVVLTSVDRDDLADGGAEHFALTIAAIKRGDSQVIVEALVPDFRGDSQAIETLVHSGVDVYAHNVETVERLQYRVRDPRAGYRQSLSTLSYAKTVAQKNDRELYTKSGLMLGLGETQEELKRAFSDLRAQNVDVLTLGQYLRPSLSHLPVERYVTPEEFYLLEQYALSLGFLYVAAGPLVRSSYRAGEFFIKKCIERRTSHAV